MRLFSLLLRRLRRQPAPPDGGGAVRVLFLDDDPERARVFLEGQPEGAWVETVADCVARLAEPWDEVHLDHDLGGEQFVDLARADCGMEVVRWLCREPRPHLKAARFFVHSHNAFAAAHMGMQLAGCGYLVELRPFGAPPLAPLPEDEPYVFDPPAPGFFRRLWAFVRREPAPLGYGYTEERGTAEASGGGEARGLDLSWAKVEYVRDLAPPPVPPADRPDFSWAQGVFFREPSGPPVERPDFSWAAPAPPPPAPHPPAPGPPRVPEHPPPGG